MAQIDLLVMVDREHRSAIDQVAKTLQARGLQVEQTLPRFRTILGKGESSLLKALQSVDGVESVRQQKTFQLPPLSEKVPQ
jgi:hypothetical protein